VTDDPPRRDRDERIKADVDPEAFLRALLRISPEDAAEVRKATGDQDDSADGPAREDD
jgi:hypothetical protein